MVCKLDGAMNEVDENKHIEITDKQIIKSWMYVAYDIGFEEGKNKNGIN